MSGITDDAFILVYENGYWVRQSEIDNPTLIKRDGKIEYWKDGIPHNLTGPAILYESGHVEYYIDGVNYNPNGPAIIDYRGGRFWKDDQGRYHRENDKPAVHRYDDVKMWFIDGTFSRTNNPSLIANDCEFSITGGTYDHVTDEVDEESYPTIELEENKVVWYNENRVIHRETYPAVIDYGNNKIQWYTNGILISEIDYND